MKKFVTHFKAVDQTDKHLKTFMSDTFIIATDFETAQIFCSIFYPYLIVVGEFICEVNYYNNNLEKDN